MAGCRDLLVNRGNLVGWIFQVICRSFWMPYVRCQTNFSQSLNFKPDKKRHDRLFNFHKWGTVKKLRSCTLVSRNVLIGRPSLIGCYYVTVFSLHSTFCALIYDCIYFFLVVHRVCSLLVSSFFTNERPASLIGLAFTRKPLIIYSTPYELSSQIQKLFIMPLPQAISRILARLKRACLVEWKITKGNVESLS